MESLIFRYISFFHLSKHGLIFLEPEIIKFLEYVVLDILLHNFGGVILTRVDSYDFLYGHFTILGPRRCPWQLQVQFFLFSRPFRAGVSVGSSGSMELLDF